MNVKLISAGAGSGKTYRLTREIVQKLKSGVPPSGILATTFTRKAATELKERVRQSLIQEGLLDAAEEVSNALIGTVNGLGTKLLQRFSFEAGLSPYVQVMEDIEGKQYFNLALANILDASKVERIQALAERLSLLPDTGSFGGSDWKEHLSRICDLARQNNFKEAALETSRAKSIETLSTFFEPTISKDYKEQLVGLRKELDFVIQEIDLDADSTVKTKNALKKVKAIRFNIEHGKAIKWSDWASLANTSPGKKSMDIFEDLIQYAQLHHRSMQFQEDLKAYISELFQLTAAAIQEYDDYKKKRGLIDYTDMEAMLDQLLDRRDVQEVLRQELHLVIVDEFQDTSPLQLNLFLKLDALAGDSIWVGDPKQSIYGFRGADPVLMSSILKEIPVAPEDIQTHSYRSRADLVHFSNAIFTQAFSDTPKEQVALIPVRTADAAEEAHRDSPDMGRAMRNWHFPIEGEKSRFSDSKFMEQIVKRLVDLLHHPPIIYCKKTASFRPLEAGDIGILCERNKTCLDFSKLLAEFGVKASIARVGIIHTQEVRLVLACLYQLLDRGDTLSVAELLYLSGQYELEDILKERAAYVLSGKREYEEPWMASETWIEQLDRLRAFSQELSITELLELILEELPIRESVSAMDNATLRLANLEQLFAHARVFESRYARMGQAATIDGFILFLQDLNWNKKDEQAATSSSDAINLLTYHKSKGLEYPFVVLYDLLRAKKSTPFGIHIVSERETLDLGDVLADRWIRFLPNPYGRSGSKTELYKALEESAIMEENTLKEKSERARLLYVGITRARDYLVIPTTEHNRPLAWLNQTYSSSFDPNESFFETIVQVPMEWEGIPIPIVQEELEEEQLDLVSFNREVQDIKVYDIERKEGTFLPLEGDWKALALDQAGEIEESTFEALSFQASLQTNGYYTLLLRLAKHLLVNQASNSSLLDYLLDQDMELTAEEAAEMHDRASALGRLLIPEGFTLAGINIPMELEKNGQIFELSADVIVHDEAGGQTAVLCYIPGESAAAHGRVIKQLSKQKNMLKAHGIYCRLINVARLQWKDF